MALGLRLAPWRRLRRPAAADNACPGQQRPRARGANGPTRSRATRGRQPACGRGLGRAARERSAVPPLARLLLLRGTRLAVARSDGGARSTRRAAAEAGGAAGTVRPKAAGAAGPLAASASPATAARAAASATSPPTAPRLLLPLPLLQLLLLLSASPTVNTRAAVTETPAATAGLADGMEEDIEADGAPATASPAAASTTTAATAATTTATAAAAAHRRALGRVMTLQ